MKRGFFYNYNFAVLPCILSKTLLSRHYNFDNSLGKNLDNSLEKVDSTGSCVVACGKDGDLHNYLDSIYFDKSFCPSIISILFFAKKVTVLNKIIRNSIVNDFAY